MKGDEEEYHRQLAISVVFICTLDFQKKELPTPQPGQRDPADPKPSELLSEPLPKLTGCERLGAGIHALAGYFRMCRNFSLFFPEPHTVGASSPRTSP